MRFQKHFVVLLAAFLLICSQNTFAQSKKKSSQSSSSDFASHLWYGGGLTLGFSGGGSSSVFQFGLAPQVGYKIVEPLSVGPRVSFLFGSYKQTGFPATSLFNIDVGGFLRYRIFQGLFFQGELSNEWYQEVYYGTTEKDNKTRFNQRIGGGYNFGGGRGGAGSEIAIMYNFAIANQLNTAYNPMEYRFVFTWGF